MPDSSVCYTRRNLRSQSSVSVERWKPKWEQKELEVIWPKNKRAYRKKSEESEERKNGLWRKEREGEKEGGFRASARKRRQKTLNWRQKLDFFFFESSSAQQTHPASLQQPFNSFNSPKWSRSVSPACFFPLSLHCSGSRFHGKSVLTAAHKNNRHKFEGWITWNKRAQT